MEGTTGVTVMWYKRMPYRWWNPHSTLAVRRYLRRTQAGEPERSAQWEDTTPMSNTYPYWKVGDRTPPPGSQLTFTGTATGSIAE